MELRPRIAITMGDPAGIGPEIIVRAFNEPLSFCQPVVVGDAKHLQRAANQFAPSVKIHPVRSVADARFENGTLDVIDLSNVPESLTPGTACSDGGRAAVECIRTAVDLARKNEVHAITTAPINKEAMHLAGHTYPGHTELLAELTDTPEVALMLAGGSLRVVLTTTHVSLDEVPKLITRDRVERILGLTHRWLQRAGIEQPRIAVTGLNPHGGDGGIFGFEEKEHIVPAIEAAKKSGINAHGPFSADALFGRLQKDNWDAVVTMYHDQGMIPIKMASMGHAVNITLGLPIIRTSVDHGTAFDIAGQGVASCESLLQALKMAATLSQPLTVTS